MTSTIDLDATATAATRSRRRWWRRPWITPLAVVVVAFVGFSLPPYLTGDPADSRVQLPTALGAGHYWLLAPHVVFGSIALTSGVLQIWPWFRRRYPAAHRQIGRAYVFAGVLPAAACAEVLAVVSPFGAVTAASNIVLGSLWLGCTIAGWRAARHRRFAEHRRWMIRSFVLTLSIITNRLWAPIFIIVLLPQLDTTFHGDQRLLIWVGSGASAWLGWVLPLLAAEWWLGRNRGRRGPSVTGGSLPLERS